MNLFLKTMKNNKSKDSLKKLLYFLHGKATANYYGYRIIAKTEAYVGTVFVYVLNDTKADAYKAKGFISAGVKLEAMMRF